MKHSDPSPDTRPNGGPAPRAMSPYQAFEMPTLLRTFQMEGADEDNHVPGGARNYWLPVAAQYAGYVCPCKGKEVAITEGDFVWRPL